MTPRTDYNKAIAGGLASGLTIIIVWLFGVLTHIAVPPEVASAFTTVIGTAGVIVMPHRS